MLQFLHMAWSEVIAAFGIVPWSLIGNVSNFICSSHWEPSSNEDWGKMSTLQVRLGSERALYKVHFFLPESVVPKEASSSVSGSCCRIKYLQYTKKLHLNSNHIHYQYLDNDGLLIRWFRVSFPFSMRRSINKVIFGFTLCNIKALHS